MINNYQELKKKFENRDKIIGCCMTIFDSPIILEKMASASPDFIVFDTEHGIFDTKSLVPSLQVLRLLGIPSIVRIQDSEYHFVAKTIDMGADGVMVPRVESLDQIETVIKGLAFSPVGKKGMGGFGQMRPGEKFEDFSKTRFLLPQIESPEGIALLPEMLERYDDYINAIIVGPYDLSVTVGTPCNVESEEMSKAVQLIFDICNKHGKSVGIFCDNEILAAKYRKMGANILWMATDRDYFMRGFTQMMEGAKKL